MDSTYDTLVEDAETTSRRLFEDSKEGFAALMVDHRISDANTQGIVRALYDNCARQKLVADILVVVYNDVTR